MKIDNVSWGMEQLILKKSQVFSNAKNAKLSNPSNDKSGDSQHTMLSKPKKLIKKGKKYPNKPTFSLLVLI